MVDIPEDRFSYNRVDLDVLKEINVIHSHSFIDRIISLLFFVIRILIVLLILKYVDVSLLFN